MSHFSKIKTSLKKGGILEKTLQELNINYSCVTNDAGSNKTSENMFDIIVPQNNGYEINFKWTGKTYELVTDLHFWDQQLSVESFLNQLTQCYAKNIILSESKEQNFSLVEQTENLNGTITLTLQRWN